MVERFSVYLSDELILMGAAKQEERPFLIYGLFCLFSSALQLILLLIAALLFHSLIQVALFAFSFGILKRTIGGWHANRHFTCLALFTALTVGCTQGGKWISAGLVLPLCLVLAALMGIIVWCRAPVEHPNNPQKPERLVQLKHISRGIAGAQLICIGASALLLRHTAFYRLPLFAALGSAVAAVALLVPNQPDQKGGEGR